MQGAEKEGEGGERGKAEMEHQLSQNSIRGNKRKPPQNDQTDNWASSKKHQQTKTNLTVHAPRNFRGNRKARTQPEHAVSENVNGGKKVV
jgi:hypothetical protein